MLLAGVYILMCAALFLFQNKLIFFPPQPQDDLYDSVSQNAISFSTSTNQLHGWNIKVNEAQTKTVIYFGGNAQDVVYLNFEAKLFKIKQLIAINHPGYGKSTGKPTQKNFYENALQVYDWALKEYQLKPEDIIVVGRSLGSSVAAYLAAKREVKALILITPFDSIENIAANQYKYFPVRLLMNHAFPTIDYIKQIKVPVLMLAAERDEIIANENLLNLKQAAGDNVKLVIYSNVGHNTIQEAVEYYPEINEFINY